MTADELTTEAVFRVALDAKAAQAGLKLVRDGRFSELRVSADRTQLRGRCRGSEPMPYEVRVDLARVGRDAGGPMDLDDQCNCSSYRRPCKHVLGLMHAYLEAPKQFVTQLLKPAGPRPTQAAEVIPEAKPRPEPKATPEEVRAAFVQAVFENPDDDAPRLMFADWLTEQGDPHGEFIRVQCELASLPAADERRAALEQRERQLLDKHRTKWSKPLTPAMKRMQPRFVRGFVGCVTTTATLFPKHAPDIFRLAPVRALRLTHFPDGIKTGRVAKCAELTRLAELDVANSGLGGDLVERLIATPFLKSLRRLDLSDNYLGPVGVRAVAEATFLQALEVLTMARCHLGPAAVEVLAGAVWLSRLKRLNLSGNGLGNAGARALANSPHLAAVGEICVVNADVGPTGRAVLRERFGDRVLP